MEDIFVYTDKTSRQANNIGDNVYYTLRKNIIGLKLIPGADISIKNISEMLDVSRSPVRDALIRLGKEGLIDTIPQKGTFVSKIDLHRVDEERFLRASLEEKVVALCVDRAEAKDIDLLYNKIMKQEESMEKEDLFGLLKYDDEFHSVMFQIADKKLCWSMIENMSGHHRRIRYMTMLDHIISEHIIKKHKEMVEAIVERDKEKIIQLSRQHLSNIDTEAKSLVKKFPSYFKSIEKSQTENINFLKKDFLDYMK